MLDELLAASGAPATAPAVRREPGDLVTRGQLFADVDRLAGLAFDAPLDGVVWVAVGDRYLCTVLTIAVLRSRSVALVERDCPLRTFDATARVGPPALVVTDDPQAPAARWAAARAIACRVVDGKTVGTGRGEAVARPALHFFSSGTTGPVKCIAVPADRLAAAVTGVASRLGITAEDAALSIAPLTHTLGMVTTVLLPLHAGGTVVFADTARPTRLRQAIADSRPTWCAASPSGHHLLHRLIHQRELPWPSLRFLRASAGPLPDALVDRLEGAWNVPLINAYAMTEAPGEIASQSLTGDRPAGTVGRPTLCQVRIGAPIGPGGGEIRISGPNVAGRTDGDGWFATGDVGEFDRQGQLRLTGRIHDVINSGGLKVWPPEVEAAALLHPAVGEAVAFPVPHEGLGETVGLAVVARPGESVDRADVRRLLMAELPRDKWPGTIVVCARLPRTERGKLNRRRLFATLQVGGVDGAASRL